MNLRKDHYREHALRGVSPTLCLQYLCCFGGPVSRLLASQLACVCQRTLTLSLMLSEHYIIVKTFNNGSLGSGIDEERSEMR